MSSRGEHLVGQLRTLLEAQAITHIRVCRYEDGKLHGESHRWQFGHEFVQVGEQPYNLNRLVTYEVVGSVLWLYF